MLDAAQAFRANATHGGGVVFVSGDSHMVGVYELRPGLLEVTASPFAAGAVPGRTITGDDDTVIYDQHRFAETRDTQFGLIEGTADGGMTVALFSKGGEKGFDEPELRLRITREGWEVAGGTDAALVNGFTPSSKNIAIAAVEAIFFGYGGAGFILVLAGVVACVFGCQCCERCKRKAQAGARRVAATGLGKGLVSALTRRRDDGDGAPPDDELELVLVPPRQHQQQQPPPQPQGRGSRVVVDEHGVRRLVSTPPPQQQISCT